MKLSTDSYSRLMLPWVNTHEEREIFLNNPMRVSVGSSHNIHRTPVFCWAFNTERVGENEIALFCNLPLDQMPLYINDSTYWRRLFAWYRLTVGR